MTEDPSSMAEKLTSLLDENKTPEEIGPAFGNMMTNMMKTIQEMPSDADPEECTRNMFKMLLGKETTERLLREKQIKEFLEQSLKTHSLTEAAMLAKTQFNLPDDFTIKLVVDVSFSSPNC